MADIELADAIRHLREQISVASLEAQSSDIKFELGPIELELKVAAKKEAGAKAGVKWLVFDAGGEAKAAAEATQTLKLTLTPKNRQGIAIDVANPSLQRPD